MSRSFTTTATRKNALRTSRLVALTLPLLLCGCYRNVFGSEYETCAEINAAIQEELTFLQACSVDADCGLILEGTSCGCTNNLVGRKGFDDTRLRSLQFRADDLNCESTVTDCSCPKADGFVCTEGVCGWNYVP
jgi:hypothetical protein